VVGKKAIKKTKGKRSQKRVESSEEDTKSSVDDSTDILEPMAPQVFDCIEVVEEES
jgi:hypothetical protein